MIRNEEAATRIQKDEGVAASLRFFQSIVKQAVEFCQVKFLDVWLSENFIDYLIEYGCYFLRRNACL